ncbi:hypothetical protein Pcinc_019502 [Petrolisthes cinctipes]|uniref:Integrase catalytic domain-containing protein n=1 Tax=Petrolisthes cinctipes TaxID=88211 RepID=A0AAE1KL38_PETCI|nr:hypothetical protein Pcinc_019502 [Petrolisthes cinctipes]
MDHRIVIPRALRNEVLRALHAAHQGTSLMQGRALGAVFWPSITKEIESTRSRFSGWPHVVASRSGAKGFISALVNYFATFGVPEELSTDGGPEFTAKETAVLLQRWGVKHRLSSAHHPQSNGRAEVAVKSMKRLLTSHTDANGSPDTEAVAAGLLQYRNTPDPQTGMSPAQIVFSRNLRDLLPIAPEKQIFTNPMVHPVWRQTWEKQEEALRLRFAKQVDDLRHNVWQLPPLVPDCTESQDGKLTTPPKDNSEDTTPQLTNGGTTPNPPMKHTAPAPPQAQEPVPGLTSAEHTSAMQPQRPRRDRRPPAYLRDYVTE